MCENTLLVDCHSFSNMPNLLNSNLPDIDVCIGFNDDETCPDKVVIGNIVHYFEPLGYKVGINNPYSNSKTFSVPIKKPFRHDRSQLYMNEQTLEKTERFNKQKQEL